jgi:copper homeostasis protein
MLEIACFSFDSLVIAQNGGANRVEFCASLEEGGVTPSLTETVAARKIIHIDLFVMIRPRGGNFCYSELEFETMKTSILAFSAIGVDGFVFGILKEDGTMDLERNQILVALAAGKPCTFHRAFDIIENKTEALAQLMKCGFTTLLTSGVPTNVNDGLDSLMQLVQQAGNQITVMPGGGLRSSNCELIKTKTKANYFHSSAITEKGEVANLAEVQLLKKLLA